jgi:hypothetical protein
MSLLGPPRVVKDCGGRFRGVVNLSKAHFFLDLLKKVALQAGFDANARDM